MTEQTHARCVQLIQNRDRAKAVFSWDGGLMHLACAGVFTVRGIAVDAAELERSKVLLKQRMGPFSSFRGFAAVPIIAMLAARGAPEKMLENTQTVYGLLKQDFWSSTYLPLAAVMLASVAAPQDFAGAAARTRALYNRMKTEHPFLTSGEDSPLCALMAVSERSDDALIHDAEQCYQRLNANFLFASDQVQALSHVLALFDGSADEKCAKTRALYEAFKTLGRKYGTGHELTVLGILAMAGGAPETVVHKVIEIDDWLANQKGFGFFSSISAKHRLMYAAIIAQEEYLHAPAVQTAVIGSAVSLLIAQEVAVYAAVSAGAMAAASASSSD